MKVIETKLSEVLVIEPDVYGDERGWFKESFQKERYAKIGIDLPFVQDNVSFSQYGVLRGLHFQHPNSQGKLVQVLMGEVFDVAVDIRVGSPTFGKWEGVSLSAENHRQFWVPPDFAHGFQVVSETALFAYKCTAFYDPNSEHTIAWDDADLSIDWPISKPQLSEKDLGRRGLYHLAEGILPVFG